MSQAKKELATAHHTRMWLIRAIRSNKMKPFEFRSSMPRNDLGLEGKVIKAMAAAISKIKKHGMITAIGHGERPKGGHGGSPETIFRVDDPAKTLEYLKMHMPRAKPKPFTKVVLPKNIIKEETIKEPIKPQLSEEQKTVDILVDMACIISQTGFSRDIGIQLLEISHKILKGSKD